MSRRAWFPALGLLVWLCCLGPVQGGKILAVPVEGSHWLSMKILVKELIQKGHDVVVLVPESSILIHSSENYRTEIYQVAYSKVELDKTINNLKDAVFLEEQGIVQLYNSISRLIKYTSMQMKGCEGLLNNQTAITRLREEGFDVLLTDPFLPCGPLLSHILSIPAVYFLRGLPCELHLEAIQVPSPLSYIPMFFSGNTDRMTFPQRIKNLAMYFTQSYMSKVIYAHFNDMVSRCLDNGMTYRELISHGAIWLLRFDFTFEWPRPVMPNMVLIGGINCAKKKPLPADLEEFVNGSEDDGFIVFTLGSLVSSMPEETAKQFFDAFRQIPQRVLWRYTGVAPQDVPQNVKLLKWLPQNDLLGHPKAKVFITHGGTHGIYESICNAVPMLMFPLFGDQLENVNRMMLRGVAEKLTAHDVTTEKILAALNKMIHDKSYKDKIVELSQQHLDRPVEPLDSAVFWTEFVIRHKGAPHLRVAAHDLNWVQYHSLDVIGFLAIILVTVVWLTVKCCLFCTRNCFRKGSLKRKSE